MDSEEIPTSALSIILSGSTLVINVSIYWGPVDNRLSFFIRILSYMFMIFFLIDISSNLLL